MSIKKERERKAFEAWFESRYDAHFMQFALDLDLYVDKHTQTCWEAWLSSANRQGYKLVPLEPDQQMIYAGESAEHKGCISVAVVYEAMIGACDECNHSSDGLLYTSNPPLLKCEKCGEFFKN